MRFFRRKRGGGGLMGIHAIVKFVIVERAGGSPRDEEASQGITLRRKREGSGDLGIENFPFAERAGGLLRDEEARWGIN